MKSCRLVTNLPLITMIAIQASISFSICIFSSCKRKCFKWITKRQDLCIYFSTSPKCIIVIVIHTSRNDTNIICVLTAMQCIFILSVFSFSCLTYSVHSPLYYLYLAMFKYFTSQSWAVKMGICNITLKLIRSLFQEIYFNFFWKSKSSFTLR